MQRYAHFDATDLKTIYRTLHRQILEEPDLLDSDFLTGLQTWLQALANGEGVDVGSHREWDEWLQQVHTPCERRMSQRRNLSLV